MARYCILVVLYYIGPYSLIALAQTGFPAETLIAIHAASAPLDNLDTANYKCESIYTSRSFQDGKRVEYTGKHVSKRSGDNAVYGNYLSRVNPQLVNTHSYVGLLSINSRYFFRAERNKTGGTWLLVKVIKRGEDLDAGGETNQQKLDITKQFVFADVRSIPLQVGKTKPEQLFSVPGFSLGSIVQSEDRKRITIAFRCFSKADTPSSPLSECRVVYDLSQFGIPVEFSEVTLTGNSSRENNVTISLQKNDDGTYTQSNNRKLIYKSGGLATHSQESEGKPVYTFGKLPDSEFTCSAFGLPEPPGYEPKPTPIYVWVLLVAVVLFVLAILLRYLSKRKN